MARKDFHKVIIGRAEELKFVEFEIHDVPAKVDTGAYRSAVHADQIKLIETENGTELSFRLLGGHPVCGEFATTFVTPHYKKVWIANSFGHREERFEVKLRVKLGAKVFWATFTLADRSKKIYPILLGRKMLSGRFMVDTERSSIDRIELKKQYGIVLPNDEEEGREV